MKRSMTAEINLKSLADKWPSSMVARERAEDFTGGIITSRYLANLDSKGEGPPRIRVGRKVVYSVELCIEWLEGRVKKV